MREPGPDLSIEITIILAVLFVIAGMVFGGC